MLALRGCGGASSESQNTQSQLRSDILGRLRTHDAELVTALGDEQCIVLGRRANKPFGRAASRIDEDDIPIKALATIYDLDYLAGNLRGGDAYDWYYADDTARAAPVTHRATRVHRRPST